MSDDPLLQPSQALVDLVRFVDQRPTDATEDDDVRALEDTAYTLGQVAASDDERLIRLLGHETAFGLGLVE